MEKELRPLEALCAAVAIQALRATVGLWLYVIIVQKIFPQAPNLSWMAILGILFCVSFAKGYSYEKPKPFDWSTVIRAIIYNGMVSAFGWVISALI